jgi:hypothetical protein
MMPKVILPPLLVVSMASMSLLQANSFITFASLKSKSVTGFKTLLSAGIAIHPVSTSKNPLRFAPTQIFSTAPAQIFSLITVKGGKHFVFVAAQKRKKEEGER